MTKPNGQTRGVLKAFLENMIRDSVAYTEHAKRNTVTALDVVYTTNYPISKPKISLFWATHMNLSLTF